MTLPATAPKPVQDDVVLVVDDDPGVASAVAEALEDDGLVVVVAHTGAEARRRLAERSIAVLLLDLRLPDLDGLVLLREVREHPAAPDVIVVTGHASIESAVEAIESGAGGYVEKPLDFVRLRRVVARSLERRRLVRENRTLVEQLDARSRQAEALYAVSATLASTLDFTEALRRLCRELARLFGADTVTSLVHDVERDLLVPSAAYHAPKDDAAALAALAVPIREQGVFLPLWAESKPVASEDVAGDPRFAHPVFRTFPHQSGLALPLIINGDVVGAFYLVWWRARRIFTADELRLAEQLCGQMSLFVRNARLFEQAERDRRRFEALNDVSRRLAAVHETDQILTLIVDAARALLDVEAAGLRLLDGTDLVLRAAVGEGAADLTARPRIGWRESLSGAVVAAGEPVVVEDLAADLRFDPLHEQAAIALGFHGWLGVPLHARDRIVGVLGVYTRSRRRFDTDAVTLLAAFADQASLAIQKGQLLAQTERARQDAELLYAIASRLSSSSGAAEILDLIVRKAVEIVRADAAAVYEYDDSRGGLVMSRAVDVPEPLARSLVLRPGEGVAGRAFSERRAVWTCDRTGDEALRYTPAAAALIAEHAPHAYLAVPIIGERAVHGVLALFHAAAHDFTPGEVHLLSTLASNAAVAIDKARLFEEMERQRHRLAEIFDSTSDGMLLVGRDGQIASANRRAGELLGFDHAAQGGLGLTGVLARHFADETEFHPAVDPLRVAVEAGEAAEGDLNLPAAGRTLRWVVRPAGPLTQASSVTLTDVTQEREVSRMKSDFVSFVTHQLRTPLAGIKWLLELGSQTLGPDDEAASYVSDAREAAERLIRLVNELLDVSRLESGKVKIAPAVVDLGELTRDVLAELGGLAKEKGQRVTVDAADVSRIVVDRQLMRQVLMNLLSNAMKYTPAGGAITVRIAERADGIAWTVRDTGIGISGEAQARLFEKFYRAPNGLAIETEGTGLGLYLTKLIVERFGGRVWCESSEGDGATFGFVVPV